MEHHFSAQQTETVSLKVEWSPVWEVILGISGYTYAQLRHTFDYDEQWTESLSSMPESFIQNLKIIEETNLWYGMIMLQNEFSAISIEDFVHKLSSLDRLSFYKILLPYKDRFTEEIRLEAANQHRSDSLQNYAGFFNDHAFLKSYVLALTHYPKEKIIDLYHCILQEWYNWMIRLEVWGKWKQALTFEQKQYTSIDHLNPTAEIERIAGIRYAPEPSVWTIKLIPHVSYRPWILEKRTADTKLFFYPLKDEYLLEPGIPSKDLIRGHKALGEELRLKLLYQLLQGPQSLQELSIAFTMSKTSLHHQLSLLKAAKFIKVEKGIYSANLSQIKSFSGKLNHYLGTGV
ncbi:ArsR family transcriptional regulator [Niallia sp. 03133]|uniref:ArsR family transcriptional regulator n=1 Tax=Niallia sp. 03133 TaxID=3458060 RepID=UPI004044E7FA